MLLVEIKVFSPCGFIQWLGHWCSSSRQGKCVQGIYVYMFCLIGSHLIISDNLYSYRLYLILVEIDLPFILLHLVWRLSWRRSLQGFMMWRTQTLFLCLSSELILVVASPLVLVWSMILLRMQRNMNQNTDLLGWVYFGFLTFLVDCLLWSLFKLR